MSAIRSMARQWRAKETRPGEDGIVVVDYLQLVVADADAWIVRSGQRLQVEA